MYVVIYFKRWTCMKTWMLSWITPHPHSVLPHLPPCVPLHPAVPSQRDIKHTTLLCCCPLDGYRHARPTQMSTVSVIIDCNQFITLTIHLSWQHLRRSTVPEIWLVPTIIHMVHVTLPRPFQGRFAIRRLALATINLPTVFEVSISTHYEDMKGNTECRKWGGLG